MYKEQIDLVHSDLNLWEQSLMEIYRSIDVYMTTNCIPQSIHKWNLIIFPDISAAAGFTVREYSSF